MEYVCLGIAGLFAVLWMEERQHRQGLQLMMAQWSLKLKEAGWKWE